MASSLEASAAGTPSAERTTSTPSNKTLRVLLGIVGVALYWIVVVAMKPVGGFPYFMTILLSPLVLFLFLTTWWLAFSRARWWERLIVWLAFVGLGIVTVFFVDPTLQNVTFVIYALPTVLTTWPLATLVVRSWKAEVRWIGVLLSISLAWFYTTLVRLDGTDGAMVARTSFRWEPRPEDIYLSELKKANNSEPKQADSDEPLMASEGDWLEFRGSQRQGIYRGKPIATDWSTQAPKLLWKHRIGPGWGSFTVVGERIFTQEQRGDREATVCYSLIDGLELWSHESEGERFEEPIAGAGPRATPTFANGRLYTVGAKGLISCLDAKTGKVFWQNDMAKQTKAAVPMWGFSASPLIVDDRVIVVACGPEQQGVIAYDAQSGEVKWKNGTGSISYSSAQEVTLAGIKQALVASDHGLQSFSPSDGKLLWEHLSESPGVPRIVQPLQLSDSELFFNSYTLGAERLKVTLDGEQWKIEQLWKSNNMKSYFNDGAVIDNALYGFDKEIFASVDLATGKRNWKKGRYGFGQVLSLEANKQLLVLSESGEVVVLEANDQELKEVARFQGIDGKTWNHPVIAHGRLLLRNGEVMACYEVLPAASDTAVP